jgi:hypothetical protein
MEYEQPTVKVYNRASVAFEVEGCIGSLAIYISERVPSAIRGRHDHRSGLRRAQWSGVVAVQRC